MNTNRLIEAMDLQNWRDALSKFECVDVCQLPEYHIAYGRLVARAKPVMWCFEMDGNHFCYPFLLTPVTLKSPDGRIEQTEFADISSVYGYSGPLSTTTDESFLGRAWSAFDTFTTQNKVIAEFTRYSLYAETKQYAHEATQIEYNRPSAISWLPDSEELLFEALGTKTRNIIRKAQNSNFVVQPLDISKNLGEFRVLYEETMSRNKASDFFFYTDQY